MFEGFNLDSEIRTAKMQGKPRKKAHGNQAFLGVFRVALFRGHEKHRLMLQA